MLIQDTLAEIIVKGLNADLENYRYAHPRPHFLQLMAVDPVGLKKQLLDIFIMHKGRDPVKRRLGKLKAAPRIDDLQGSHVSHHLGQYLPV